MALQDLIILDHFLYSFEVPAFNRIKSLCDIIKHCEYHKIDRPDATYEGVYLFAQDGSYLEMLKHPLQSPKIGALAVSSLSPNQEPVRLLPSRYPQLQWFTHQIRAADDKPWYTYFGQVPIEEIQRQGFMLWAMLYDNLQRHRAFQYQKKPPSNKEFTVQEITATRIKMPSRYLDTLRHQSQWLPGDHNISDSKIILRIVNPSFHEFEVTIEADKHETESKFVSVTMKLNSEARIESQQIKGFRLTRLQDKLVLNF
jgi:hypothetical protein